MNKRILKTIMSLVLVVVMAVSTMMVSAVSTSAATGNAEYKFDFQTAGHYGTTVNTISIKVNGDKGSTSWHNIGLVAITKKGSCSFSDINVGAIKSITVKNNGSDGWYPEIINITVGGTTTTIYGGRWVDDEKEVTISATDRVAKLTVKTSDKSLAGTDSNIHIKLCDYKGNETKEVNLSNIHTELNAFERNDKSTFYIHVPENFDKVLKLNIKIDLGSDDWCLDYIDVTLDDETTRFGAYDYFDGEFSLYSKNYIYKVTVKTSDVKYAGTDSDVYLYTYNEYGTKNYKFVLDDSNNNFERGDTDVFYISTSMKTTDIKILIDNSLGADWHLDYIKLDQLLGPDDYTVVESTKYKFNKWIKADDELHDPTSKEKMIAGLTEYKFDFQTAGSDGKSSDDIFIKVNGDKGSTSWHNISKIAKNGTGSTSFFDIDVGTIKSVTVKNSSIDGWYPEIINITVGETTTTIYGGRWVDDKNEVTLSVTDRVAEVTVQTSNDEYSGTDADVFINLMDDKGNETGDINLSMIHPRSNAFEGGDRATFYIHVPDNFGELTKIRIGPSIGFGVDRWDLDHVEVILDGEIKVFPCYCEVDNNLKQ